MRRLRFFIVVSFLLVVCVLIQNLVKRSHSFRNIVNKEFTCQSLDELHVHTVIGSGAYRHTYAGTFRGVDVAVKTIKVRFTSFFGQHLLDKEREAEINCLRLFRDLQDVHVKTLMEAIKTECTSLNVGHMISEIIYNSVLKHDTVVKHFGYCLREPKTSAIKPGQVQMANINKKTAKALFESSIISVSELGSVLAEEDVVAMPIQERLRQTRELAVMVGTLHNTLVGPIQISDLKLEHLMYNNGKWKVFDLGMFLSGDKQIDHPWTRNIMLFCRQVLNIVFKNNSLYDNDKCQTMSSTKYIDYMESIKSPN